MVADERIHLRICSAYSQEPPPGEDVPEGWVSYPVRWDGRDVGMVVAYDPRQTAVIAVGGAEDGLTDGNHREIERLGYRRWLLGRAWCRAVGGGDT